MAITSLVILSYACKYQIKFSSLWFHVRSKLWNKNSQKKYLSFKYAKYVAQKYNSECDKKNVIKIYLVFILIKLGGWIPFGGVLWRSDAVNGPCLWKEAEKRIKKNNQLDFNVKSSELEDTYLKFLHPLRICPHSLQFCWHKDSK